MLVREEVVFAAHVGHLQESQALSSERLGSPALYFPVQSDPLERGYRLCARACLITADLYTTIGMVSGSQYPSVLLSAFGISSSHYHRLLSSEEGPLSFLLLSPHKNSSDLTMHSQPPDARLESRRTEVERERGALAHVPTCTLPFKEASSSEEISGFPS